MKRAIQTGMFLAGLGCACLTARADVPGDYKVILDRNPFGLKPPPEPVKPEPPPPVETPSNYKLSGITGLFKPPRAMFVNQVPGKPTPEYLSLSEGQRQGSLEVLLGGIDIKGGKVRVKISGEERTLSFEKDGLKAAAAPAVITQPGVTLPPNQFNPVPAAPGGTIVAPPGLPPPQFNRPAVAPTPVPGGAMGAPAAAPVIQVNPGASGMPARTIRVPVTPTLGQQNQTSPPPAPNVDPATQALLMEINRTKDASKTIIGELPPLPPTDLTGR